MLAQAEIARFEGDVLLSSRSLPLLHEFQSVLFGFVHWDRVGSSNIIDHNILQFNRKFPREHLFDGFISLFPPIFSLRGNVGRRDDAYMGINQEKCKDLAVPWLGSVFQ